MAARLIRAESENNREIQLTAISAFCDHVGHFQIFITEKEWCRKDSISKSLDLLLLSWVVPKVLFHACQVANTVFWKCMLRSIRNVKLLKCVSLICLSPLFVFYSSLNYDGPRTKGFYFAYFFIWKMTSSNKIWLSDAVKRVPEI